MNLRKSFLVLVMFGVWTFPAYGQNPNLLKNPNGDESTEHWMAFKDAKVEQCPTGGRCFALRGGGYFTQDVVIPKDAVGQFALLIGRGYSEGSTALPSLYGYMMNSGDPSGGRIYANLTGPLMTGSVDSSNNWTKLWGIFRVKSGTRRLRFFLRQSAPKDSGFNGITRFGDLGLYIFPTEVQARAFVNQSVPDAAFGPPTKIENKSQCWVAREVMPSLYGIQLGMSLQDVLSRFPEAINEPSVVRALEFSRSPFAAAQIRMLIVNRSGDHALREVRQILFAFFHKRLFSLTVELHSPQWKDVEEFIGQRADLLNLQDLPQASAWEQVEGNAQGGRYLICHGIEIRFYAAPQGSGNKSLLSLTDTAVEADLSANSKP